MPKDKITVVNGAIHVLHAGTERTEHIHILITSVQETDNVIPTQDRSCGLSLSTIWAGVIKTAMNIRI